MDPNLALYSGARVNELAQLKVHDIVNEDGVWCIAIQLTVDDDLADNEYFKTRQTVKGASALRRIPIHQAVTEAGFIDFVEDIKACGHPGCSQTCLPGRVKPRVRRALDTAKAW